jgi:hypothetical protein
MKPNPNNVKRLRDSLSEEKLRRVKRDLGKFCAAQKLHIQLGGA